MKYSKYFLKTSKSFSNKDKTISARLLKQAGFVQESVAGRYYFLPIGHVVQQKIMKVIKEEMDNAGCHEMVSPVLHPLSLWEETNRTCTTGFELMQVKDRRGTKFALGGTAEEMFVDLIRKYKISYKDLPFHLYQFSTKFRDELRARGGLLRVREFIMKDGYSFHKDAQDFQIEYEKLREVYTRIFDRLGLETDVVLADNGYIGGEYSHEFIVESDIGESKYFVTKDGKYTVHEELAVFEKEMKNVNEAPRELVEIDAVRGTTMDDGVKLHNLPGWQQIKDVLFVDDTGRFILAIIRGDLDVNEIKLKNLLKADALRLATNEEVREKVNSEPGFISPVKIKDGLDSNVELIIVADDSLRTIANAYGGANIQYKDLQNINIDRDYTPDVEGDIAMAKVGYKAKDHAGLLIEKKGIEVGNIFQLGYHYSTRMKGATFVDADGKEKPFYMGCYGIGAGRTMAAIVEKHNDEKGIIWPKVVAPFQIHLIALDGGYDEAEKLYVEMKEKGLDVFYDDRDKTAGEKFADADLIGLPIRIVVSKKTLQEKNCEFKKRNESEATLIPLSLIVQNLLKND